MSTLLQRLNHCIETVLGAQPGTVVTNSETSIINDLSLDSIAMVGLVFLCEEEFRLPLSDYSAELFEVRTVGQLAQLIQEKGGQ